MPQNFSHRFRATQMEARNSIAAIMGRLQTLGLPVHHAGNVEIALAEAVNNVVEHAYQGRGAGDVEIRGRLAADLLVIHIFDSGLPLPSGKIPPPCPANLTGPRQALPEGGFGWSLIHELASAIRYARGDNCNRLSMHFSLVSPEAAAPGAQREAP